MIAAPDVIRRKDQLVPDNRVVNGRAFLDCRGRADQLRFQHTDPVILQIVHKVYPVTLISLRSPCGTLLRILVVDRPGESRIDNRVWINNPVGIPETSRQQVRRDAPRNDSAIVSPKIPGLLRPVQMRRLVQVAGIDAEPPFRGLLPHVIVKIHGHLNPVSADIPLDDPVHIGDRAASQLVPAIGIGTVTIAPWKIAGIVIMDGMG